MNEPIRIIIVLALIGFAVGAVSGGDVNSLNPDILLQKLDSFLKSTGIEPLQNIVGDMRAAFAFLKEEAFKLLDAIKQR